MKILTVVLFPLAFLATALGALTLVEQYTAILFASIAGAAIHIAVGVDVVSHYIETDN